MLSNSLESCIVASCRALAQLVNELIGKSGYSASFKTIQPGLIWVVDVKCMSAAHVKEEVTVTRLEMLRDAPISVSALGDPGTSGTLNCPIEIESSTWTGVGADGASSKRVDQSIMPATYAERMDRIAQKLLREYGPSIGGAPAATA
jgi:hypothetical protein